MGAAIGSAIPGIGTAIGALGGAVLGYVQGQNSVFENKDNSFKAYYQDLYNDALGTQNQALTSGTGIASTREANKISFSTLLGGDDNANEFLDSLVDFAAVTPFAYDELTNISKVLLAYGYKQEELLPLLEKVGDTGSALGMNPEDMKYIATALGRMQVTGKTTMEYLNPLLERGIDVWSYLSEASGKTKKQVQEMVSKGLVPGEKAAKAIADYMGYNYAGNMERQAETYSGLISTLEDSQAEIDNAMGEGYNSTRKKGLQEQIDFLSGESGEGMQEAYNKIGQWKASLENMAEQYQRDAYSAVMSGTVSAQFSPETQERLAEMYEEYTKYAADGSEEAGAKMGALLAEAQAIATNEYNASEGAQLALESNITLAENIKNDTATQEAYWDAGYTMGQQFTKGLASAFELAEKEAMRAAGEKAPNISALMELTPEEAAEMAGLTTNKNKPKGPSAAPNVSAIMNLTPEQIMNGSYAYGLNYVPYDNYPALLHQGERVLTASENRSHGSGVQVSITGNNFTVRSEDDIEKIGDIVANKVAQQMNQALLLAN
jgi:tape measure domain-containing protein